MSSFFKKAFGWIGGSSEGGAAPPSKQESETYKDCTIVAAPVKEGTQWRLAGTITRTVDGETWERTFVRADLFASEGEAARFAISKAKLIIDQNPALFSGEKTGSA